MANDRFEMTPHAAFETPLAIGAEKVTAFLRKVYGWMFAGLAITATVSYLVIGSPQVLQLIVGNPFVFFGLILVELGLVFFLSARVDKMAPQTAATLFVVYSVLNGATLSAILIAYTGTSIATNEKSCVPWF